MICISLCGWSIVHDYCNCFSKSFKLTCQCDSMCLQLFVCSFQLTRGVGAALKQSARGEGGQGQPGWTGGHYTTCFAPDSSKHPNMAGECDGCGWMGRYIKFSLSETQVHSRVQQLSHTVRDRMSRCQVGVITMAIEQLFSRTVNSCRLPQRKKAAWSQSCVARNKSHNWHTPCDSIWQIEVRFYFWQATLVFPFKIAIMQINFSFALRIWFEKACNWP